MGLAFKPEDYAVLRARFPAALEKVYDRTDIGRGGDRPGLHRANVFDTREGIRVIVSREVSDEKDMLHVSGSHQISPFRTIEDAVTVSAAFRKIAGIDFDTVGEIVMTT